MRNSTKRQNEIHSKIRILKERHNCWLNKINENDAHGSKASTSMKSNLDENNSKLNKNDSKFIENEFVMNISYQIVNEIQKKLQLPITTNHEWKIVNPMDIFFNPYDSNNQVEKWMKDQYESKKEQFIMEYENIHIRYHALSEENENLENQYAQLQNIKCNIQIILDRENIKREEIQNQMNQYANQLSSIEREIQTQEMKYNETNLLFLDVEEQMKMIQMTLNTMKKDMEKTSALAEAVGATSHELQS